MKKLKNRFDKKLQEENQIIADFSHGSSVLKIITALEVRKMKPHLASPSKGEEYKIKVLEIGCGEGNFTEYFLRYNPKLKIDALDISDKMIAGAKKKLATWRKNINFICQDGLEFLKNSPENYDMIISSWTVHNFKWTEKTELFKVIYNRLGNGGKLFLLDKVYSDNFKESKKQFDKLCRRYKNYLPADLSREIISHAKQDFSESYRMDEKNILNKLKVAGFKEVKIIDREAEEAILTARK